MIGYIENGKLVHIGEWTEEQDVQVGTEKVVRDGREIEEPIYEKQPVPIPDTWARHTDLVLSDLPDGGKCLAGDYQKLRKERYPSSGEQFDALYKAVLALSGGQPIPPDAQIVLDEITNIKNLNPKT